MTIADIINEKHCIWRSQNMPEPDTILMSTEDYFNFIKEVNENHVANIPVFNAHSINKYRGIDVIDSNKIKNGDIRVCKTIL